MIIKRRIRKQQKITKLRNKRKDFERQETQRQLEEYDNERKKRREHLEQEKSERIIKREGSEAIKINNRRTVKGRKTKNLDNPRRISMSPVRYGMDLEIQQKMESKLVEDLELEEAALDWIELLTGEEVDDLHLSLKSGELLCRLINTIYPGTIAKYNKKNIPALHRENIQKYLAACEQLGVPKHELFTVPDLYDRRGLSAVLTNLYALGRITQQECESNDFIRSSLMLKGGKPVLYTRPETPAQAQIYAIAPSLQPRTPSPQSSPQQDRRARRRTRTSLILQQQQGGDALRKSIVTHDAIVQQPQLRVSLPSPLRQSLTASLTEPLLPKEEPVEEKKKERSCCCVVM